MALILGLFLSLLCFVHGQNDILRVCIPATETQFCQILDSNQNRVICESVDSNVDCALKLARGTADFGVFSSEELLLLAQLQPNEPRVIAAAREDNRDTPYAFEAVAVVQSAHTGGLDGLNGYRYCHPGLGVIDERWSARVLRALEYRAASTDRCQEEETLDRTAEELEVQRLAGFFSGGCRPGPWSANATIDANLKRNYPSLCSLCGPTEASSSCSGYTIDMGVAVSGVSNTNPHMQALECATRAQNRSVAFVAWQHVRDYFRMRASDISESYSVLCENGTMALLTAATLESVQSPCAFVQQPWKGVVASATKAAAILGDMRTWWPAGTFPTDANSWQARLFTTLVGGPGLRLVYNDALPTPATYMSARTLADIDSTTSCMPARRWCTTSAQENVKCNWVRRSAYTLGLQPAISCQQRENVFQCLQDIKEQRADFISTDSNYGYLARAHYSLSPVKLFQNSRSNARSMSRVVALVKETSAQSEITRFENLRDKRACFPEFGGIAYVTFVRTAHERSIISASECDYARAVGEFFSGACAPGAVDASHALSASSSFNSSTLCTACRPAVNVMGGSDFTCAWDHSNLYFGDNGTLACLSDNSTHVAFVEQQDLDVHLRSLNLAASQFRVLCRNNTLAATTGIAVDDGCLLAYVVDGEVLARRNDPQQNSLSSLLELLDDAFGYLSVNKLIDLKIFSPFDGVSDLLFKDTATGLTEPSLETSHEPAKNYIELFRHLEACTGGAVGLNSGKAGFWSVLTLVVATLMSKWVM